MVQVHARAVVKRIKYDAYDRVLLVMNPGSQPLGYADGFYGPEIGLTPFGARGYDPQTGRRTSKEPIPFAMGDLDLSDYVFGNPENPMDALGVAAESCAPSADPWPYVHGLLGRITE